MIQTPPWIGWTRSAMDVHSHLLTPDRDDAHVGATTVFKLPGTIVMLERPDAVTWRHVFFKVLV